MKEDMQLLRVGIDGSWEARDFAASFSALDRLYSLRLALMMQMDELAQYDDFLKGNRLYFDPQFLGIRSRGSRFFSRSVFRSERSLLVTASRISEDLLSLIEPTERLEVKRVTYGSKGSKDLSGIGEVIGHLKEFLIHLIDLYTTKEQRALKNEHRHLENEKLRLQNAERLVEIARHLGYTKIERRQFIAAVLHEQKPLEQLIALGKITSAGHAEDQQA